MAINKTKQCYFCAANINLVDFKDAQMLRKFMTPQAQIARRRKTGACSLHQRKLAQAIKRARNLGLAPYISR